MSYYIFLLGDRQSPVRCGVPPGGEPGGAAGLIPPLPRPLCWLEVPLLPREGPSTSISTWGPRGFNPRPLIGAQRGLWSLTVADL